MSQMRYRCVDGSWEEEERCANLAGAGCMSLQHNEMYCIQRKSGQLSKNYSMQQHANHPHEAVNVSMNKWQKRRQPLVIYVWITPLCSELMHQVANIIPQLSVKFSWACMQIHATISRYVNNWKETAWTSHQRVSVVIPLYVRQMATSIMTYTSPLDNKSRGKDNFHWNNSAR